MPDAPLKLKPETAQVQDRTSTELDPLLACQVDDVVDDLIEDVKSYIQAQDLMPALTWAAARILASAESRAMASGADSPDARGGVSMAESTLGARVVGEVDVAERAAAESASREGRAGRATFTLSPALEAEVERKSEEMAIPKGQVILKALRLLRTVDDAIRERKRVAVIDDVAEIEQDIRL